MPKTKKDFQRTKRTLTGKKLARNVTNTDVKTRSVFVGEQNLYIEDRKLVESRVQNMVKHLGHYNENMRKDAVRSWIGLFNQLKADVGVAQVALDFWNRWKAYVVIGNNRNQWVMGKLLDLFTQNESASAVRLLLLDLFQLVMPHIPFPSFSPYYHTWIAYIRVGLSHQIGSVRMDSLSLLLQLANWYPSISLGLIAKSMPFYASLVKSMAINRIDSLDMGKRWSKKWQGHVVSTLDDILQVAEQYPGNGLGDQVYTLEDVDQEVVGYYGVEEVKPVMRLLGNVHEEDFLSLVDVEENILYFLTQWQERSPTGMAMDSIDMKGLVQIARILKRLLLIRLKWRAAAETACYQYEGVKERWEKIRKAMEKHILPLLPLGRYVKEEGESYKLQSRLNVYMIQIVYALVVEGGKEERLQIYKRIITECVVEALSSFEPTYTHGLIDMVQGLVRGDEEGRREALTESIVAHARYSHVRMPIYGSIVTWVRRGLSSGWLDVNKEEMQDWLSDLGERVRQCHQKHVFSIHSIVYLLHDVIAGEMIPAPKLHRLMHSLQPFFQGISDHPDMSTYATLPEALQVKLMHTLSYWDKQVGWEEVVGGVEKGLRENYQQQLQAICNRVEAH